MKSTVQRRLAQCLAALRAAAGAAAEGQGLVEYAAILSFIAAVVVSAVVYLGPHIAMSLNNVTNSFH